jgi:hypothetical protein
MDREKQSPIHPMTPETTADDLRTELTEENGFCRLEVRATRGEGTRDSERITAELARGTLEEVEEQRPAMLAMVRETIEETREMQAGDGEEESQ